MSFFQFKFHERFNASSDAEAFLKDLFADKAVKQIFGVRPIVPFLNDSYIYYTSP